MDNLEITKEGKSEILTFSDNILKENIRDLRELMIDSIDRSESLTIEFHDFKKTDMFFIQLLCSAHKYAVSKSKTINIIGSLPDTIKTILENYGFYKDTGCIKDVGDSCFWLREVDNV